MNKIKIIGILILLILSSCEEENINISTKVDLSDSWKTVKENIDLDLHLTEEFKKPYQLPISTLSWEDGLYISRNGLNLYTTFLPVDYLSYVANKDSNENLYLYKRGPTYGMDLETDPIGHEPDWIHSDILYSHRNSTDEPFLDWELSNMAQHTWSEGGSDAIFSDSENIDMFVYTTNNKPPTYDLDIKLIRKTKRNPSGEGVSLNGINTEYVEDNPNIEKIDNKLILFFDSDNRPGGKGSHDIWLSISEDEGKTWSTPTNDISINTSKQEHQPHLYKGKDGIWYLYYTAAYTDGKLGIYRVKQTKKGDWKNWDSKEIIISSGNAVAIGEPTLTSEGDLSFVVISENPNGTKYNKYDSDPWVIKHK